MQSDSNTKKQTAMNSNSQRQPATDSNGQEQLEPTAAFHLAARLVVIPGFPRREEAIEAVADWLIERCKPRQHEGALWNAKRQAEWVISTAVEEFGEWPGVPGLRMLWLGKFHPGLIEYQGLGARPRVGCDKCQDNGIIERVGGGAEWCDCPAAQHLREQIPNLCDDRNRRAAARASKRKPQPAPARAALPQFEPITQEDINRALAARHAAQPSTHTPLAVKDQGSQKGAKSPARRN